MKHFFAQSALLFICSICVTALYADKTILKKEKLKIKVGLNAAVNFEANLEDEYAGFVIDAAKLKLSAQYRNNLKLYLSLDPSKPNSSSKDGYSEPLDKLYLQWRINSAVRFRVGQFKVPFGHELFQGLEERPVVTHRKTTKEICPDLDRGIMVYGKKIGGWFEYYTGIFNGTSVEQSFSSASGLLPLKLQMHKKWHRVELYAGVNAFMRGTRPYNGEMKYRLGTGLFSEFIFTTREKGNKGRFLVEMIEKLDIREWETSEKAWERGLFCSGAYRIRMVEPALYAELFDNNSNIDDRGDRFYLGGGFNLFLFDDYLRVTGQVELEERYHDESRNITGIISVRGFL